MKPGIYGKRVIGAEQAAREAVIIKHKAHIYGKRVTGIDPKQLEAEANAAADAAAAKAAGKETAEHQHVRKVSEELVSEDEQVYKIITTGCEGCDEIFDVRRELANPDGAEKTMSVKELEAALAGNPAALDELLLTELEREGDGARLGALRALREVEGQRKAEEGGPRADILKLIDDAIAAKQQKKD